MSIPAAEPALPRRTILAVAVLASSVTFLDGSIVSVALPAIRASLGGGLAIQQWAVDGYLLTLGALMLVAGALSDGYGRVRVLRWGLIGFAATSLLAALAPTGELLVAARCLQGISGALLVPSSLALLTSSFRGAEQAKAIGTWTAWTSVAGLAGPLLGGILVDTIGWRSVFGIVLLPAIATLALVHRLPPDAPRTAARARIDVIGAVLAAVGLGGTVYALIEGGASGWGHLGVLGPLVVGVVALGSFLWWERHTRLPMLPLTLFRSRGFAVGNLATAFIYAGLSASGILVPLIVQELAGLPATVSGLFSLPTAVLLILLSGRVGALAGRIGTRPFLVVGPLVIAAGFLLLLLTRHPLDVWTQLLPGVVVFSLGLSLTVAPLTSTVLGAVSTAQSGIASAVNNAVSRVAGLVAIALLGLVTGETLDIAGVHRVAIAVSALLVASAIVFAVGLRRTDQEAAPGSSAESPASA